MRRCRAAAAAATTAPMSILLLARVRLERAPAVPEFLRRLELPESSLGGTAGEIVHLRCANQRVVPYDEAAGGIGPRVGHEARRVAGQRNDHRRSADDGVDDA